MLGINQGLAPHSAADDVDDKIDDAALEPADSPSRPSHRVGRLWRKVSCKLKAIKNSVAHLIDWQGKKAEVAEVIEEDFWRSMKVTSVDHDGNHVRTLHARALFDTGCKPNLVTEKWLRDHNLVHLVDWTTSETEFVRHKNTQSRVTGEVTLDLYGRDKPYKRQRVFLKEKTMTCRFFVVSDKGYDLIIGVDTIQDESLFDKGIPCFAETQGGFSSSVKVSEEKKRKAAIEAQQAKKAQQNAAKKQQSGSANKSSK